MLDRAMATDKSKTLSVKLYTDVVESARIVAAYRNEQIADLLSGILRPVLDRMEQEAIQARHPGQRPRATK